ncbi:hypothetical protein DSC45_29845 [Streptomyces sp. YIM 130001]|uniref:DUF2180 family protein n=1 Tax=Streptomyces sp. YIM 130001 TaxID=2259644 RepID=UPI000E650C48|nr:DUF2180 family protein [Streptomyces sp. YIM 130001]RII09712.1 hypothetical protein DSC45_29845 [Streptomyces sp. YIM 130001]
MNCYDCHLAGVVTPALATCTYCGAGVCRQHLHEGTSEVHEVSGTGAAGRRDPARRITCQVCHSAELS